MPQSFSEVFWGKGDEYTGSYEGFEALYKRLKEGNSMTQALLEVVTKRAQIERQYGESMLKLAETKHKDGLGDLKAAWDMLMLATKNVGQKHLDVSRLIQTDLAVKLRDFSNSQNTTRHNCKKGFMEKQERREKAYLHLNKAKKMSEKACHDYYDYRNSVEVMQTGQGFNAKEIDKARIKSDKAKIAAETADLDYRYAVQGMETIKEGWEREWESCCQTFQEQETERIGQLRDSMWTLSNMGSLTCVMDDNQYEGVRESLQRVEVDKELDTMVASRQTGRLHPATIVYASFYKEATPANTVPEVAKTTGGEAAATTLLDGGEAANTGMKKDSLDGLDNQHREAASSSNIPPMPAKEAPETEAEPHGVAYKALFNYTAQGPAELSFQQGDIVQIVGTAEDPWWRGELNGQSGMVYKEFLDHN
eukprot:Ihof_evm2s329 gene=Ihof_evmTU2s329